MKPRVMDNFKGFSVTLATAVLGGLLFKLFHIPVPWLLGPMVAMVIGTNFVKYPFVWHRSLRSSGLMIVGYTIGLSMTAAALQDIAKQLPYMFLMTFSLLLLCSAIAFVVSKLSASDYHTSLLACTPGGLSQILTFAEETKGINFSVVAVTQITRLMLIILLMPLIVHLPMFWEQSAVATEVVTTSVARISLFPNVLIFAAAGIAFAFLGKKIKLPTAQLLGPVIATTLLQLAGLQGPELPSIIINAAQLMIGTYVGMLLRTDTLPEKKKTIGLALVSGILLITGSILLSFLLTKIRPFTSATALLSLAPGGMDQMGIIAHAVSADLSTVSGYQLFRTFFIYFFVPPLIHFIFKERKGGGRRRSKKKGKKSLSTM